MAHSFVSTASSLFTQRGLVLFANMVTLIGAAALAGCGGGSDSPTAPSAVAAAPAIAPAPEVQLALSASNVAANQASTLTWSSSNASSCTASGAWIGSRIVSGSTSVSQATAGSYPYNITCTGAGGSSTASAVLAVVPTPVIQIALSARQVALNSPSTLTWSASNASSCTATGAWAGIQAASGSLVVNQAAAGNYTYGLNCTGVGGTASASTALSVVTGASSDNVLAVTIDSGPNNASLNMPFVSVTVCRPGTAVCQTVDHVLLDTGSHGLRLLASAVNLTTLALPAVNNAASTPVAECMQFVSGYTWGSVRRADVQLSAEFASALPVQIIAETASPYANVPDSCSKLGADLGSVSRIGANGILGVGLFNQDCGSLCSVNAASGLYFACTPTVCSGTALPLASQVANPVAAFAVNNNGVVVVLPSVAAGGATSATGLLIFGIGTQSNNQLGSATVYAVNSAGYFTTVYKGATYSDSFIDSGSNGLFFEDASIALCSGSSGFYCPSSTLSLSAVNTSSTGAPSGAVNFTVESLRPLAGTTAAANVGGTLPALSGAFDWGLPFFFGRAVFVAIKGASTPGGNGPYWGY